VTVEWARVAPDRVIVATPEAAWVHRPARGLPDEFDTPMTGQGSVATTMRLLDGAIGAACVGRRPTPAAATLTPLRWAWRLAGYYRTTDATTRLLPEAAGRFRAAGRTALESWARTRTREERGHDRLALRDIRALGYDPDLVVARFDPPGASALVRYFTQAVQDAPDPIGCVGYAYALERLAMERGLREVDAVQAMLPPGVNATRCLRVHSAAGSDASHVADTLRMVARLSPAERAAVARATYQTARLFYRPGAPMPADRELRDRLFTHP
jgi:hypothetical protein